MGFELWLIWAILAAIFAAMMTVFAKLGLSGIDPDLAQFIRTLVVLPICAALVSANNKWPTMLEWSGRTWLFLILSGLATGISWLCYFRAIDLGDASRVAAVDKLSVVIVALLAAGMLQERLGIAGWFGIVLIAAGLVLLTVST